MPSILISAGPTANELLDVCEAVVARDYSAKALGARTGSSIQFDAAEPQVRGSGSAKAFAFVASYVGMIFVLVKSLLRVGAKTTPVRVGVVSHADGWIVRTEGRNVAIQYDFLASVADFAVVKKWISSAERDSVLAALDHE